jgi:iron complex transport system ATP-binding protein
MICGHAVTVGYGERIVLDALSFRFEPWRTTAILGPGGSGKSTLLQLLGGSAVQTRWTRGALTLPRGPCAILPQRLALGDCRTLSERLHEARPDSVPRRVLSALWRGVDEQAWMALNDALKAPPSILCSGLVRLIELTAVAAMPAGTILLDEPEAGLEEQHRHWAEAFLCMLQHRRTIIVVTHHLMLARSIADDVLLLVDGSIVEAGARDEFFERAVHERTRDFIRMGC